ncbi:MAG TPA: Sec-independent protein translocase protein TatB [Xanthobacteraceae bacterium]|nr:Sec-independent protein translocase protein TatB [Xanthobacteraceae bacterium]
MFDISWGELVLIGVVALIVIGPKELPTVLRTVGQWMTKMRRMAAEFQNQFHEAMREAEFADLKREVESIADPTRVLSHANPLETAQKEIATAVAADRDPPPVTPSGEAPPPAGAEATASPSGEPSPPGQDHGADVTAPAPADGAPRSAAEGGRAA